MLTSNRQFSSFVSALRNISIHVEAGSLEEVVKAYADVAPDELIESFIGNMGGSGLSESDKDQIFKLYEYGYKLIVKLKKSIRSSFTKKNVKNLVLDIAPMFMNDLEIMQENFPLYMNNMENPNVIRSILENPKQNNVHILANSVNAMDTMLVFALKDFKKRPFPEYNSLYSQYETFINSSKFQNMFDKVKELRSNILDGSSNEVDVYDIRQLKWKGPWVSAKQWYSVMDAVLGEYGYNDFEPKNLGQFIPNLFGHLRMKLGRESSPVTYARGFQDGEDLISFMGMMADKGLAHKVHVVKPGSSKIYDSKRNIRKDRRKILSLVGDPAQAVVRVWWD